MKPTGQEYVSVIIPICNIVDGPQVGWIWYKGGTGWTRIPVVAYDAEKGIVETRTHLHHIIQEVKHDNSISQRTYTTV